MKKSLFILLSAAVSAFLLAKPPARAKQRLVLTAVNSEVYNGYVHRKLPDGSYKREYYAIADGGFSPGDIRDPSIDSVKFPPLAGLIAEFLATRGYFFANDAKSANLLLVIKWGTTTPAVDQGSHQNATDDLLTAMNSYHAAAAAAAGTPRTVDGIESPQSAVANADRATFEQYLYQMQLSNIMRRQADLHDAQLLGYVKAINRLDGILRQVGDETPYEDLISEIEEPRYYVILAAYDFRAATQQRKKKLLWVTRVSIRAQGNQFNKDLPAMLANAAPYFGRDSGGLIHRLRRGVVTIGKLKFLGVETNKQATKKAQ